ncbi:hypothetical protein L1987_07021 [Smallanthus sonchifolius]|uniref:Uncharacterized protein n=1 Tax=Smallanthus sonchifolius TaxID=185202 RepID=A0ACB9JZR2_9ASTR|nr:hypothetical protein L1987_07021 [Smallanthus sonchifolius]
MPEKQCSSSLSNASCPTSTKRRTVDTSISSSTQRREEEEIQKGIHRISIICRWIISFIIPPFAINQSINL